jgi:hypothetical protein
VAAFAPKEWTITVNNTNTDGGTARGSGGIFPPIWCGTYYNGPTVQKNTQCSSPARAAAQANDTRTIVFEPNVQGPGDTRAEWEVDHVDGCDVVTPGGHGAQCSILLEADRTVTVSWKRVN